MLLQWRLVAATLKLPHLRSWDQIGANKCAVSSAVQCSGAGKAWHQTWAQLVPVIPEEHPPRRTACALSFYWGFLALFLLPDRHASTLKKGFRKHV